MRLIITGSKGFIGQNLNARCREEQHIDVLPFNRGQDLSFLRHQIDQADAIVHLAGASRPSADDDFTHKNVDLTKDIIDLIKQSGRKVPLIFSSSIKAEEKTAYGASKYQAEQIVKQFHQETKTPVVIYRLPGVFGKWCKPNYNSVVATFCHNIARGLPIDIHDPKTMLRLVYIDDVIAHFMKILSAMPQELHEEKVTPEYTVTLAQLASHIEFFKNSHTNLMPGRVGEGFLRALYATYMSHLPCEDFVDKLTLHQDDRGLFAEILKTPDCGQFSYFTAHPGITRGEHYHHTKTEKFCVIKGSASFRFRHIVTGDTYEISSSGKAPKIIQTVPGWAHNITNTGSDEMIVLLWANEVFDAGRPDTIEHRV